jgi:hypothetical protein
MPTCGLVVPVTWLHGRGFPSAGHIAAMTAVLVEKRYPSVYSVSSRTHEAVCCLFDLPGVNLAKIHLIH